MQSLITRCLSFEIDARENGIHSLAEALKAFKEFHENKKDDKKRAYALKDAIIRSHHAIEALFKFALFKIDPVLLLKQDEKIAKVVNGYKKLYASEFESILDDEHTLTITLEDTIDRLNQIGVLAGVANPGEYKFYLEAVRELSVFRNKLQHFRLKADPELLARILGAVVPRSIIIIEATYAEIVVRNKNQMIRLFGLMPLQSELDQVYPEWKAVYGILANDYDELVKKAIAAIRKQMFKDVKITLAIDDHGSVGAPPYMPEIKCDGFLTFKVEPHMFWMMPEEQYGDDMPYSGEVRISEPQMSKSEGYSKTTATGGLELSALIYLDASRTLKVQGIEKEISVLRGMKVKIQANVNYEAETYAADWNYSADKITKAQGMLTLVVEIMPMGSKNAKEELIGEFKSTLSETNAPFRLRAFRNPDGSLRDNRSLDWSINAVGDLTFL